MFKHRMKPTYLLISVLVILSAIIMMKGCKNGQQKQTTAPEQEQKLTLTIVKSSDPRAKATGLSITVTAQESGAVVFSQTFSNPQLPVQTELSLTTPPCNYTATGTLTLTRDPPRSASVDFNACQSQEGLQLILDPFEIFIVYGNPIQSPDPVNAGQTISVTCTGSGIDAPDSDQYPLTATLSETDGNTVTGGIEPGLEDVDGEFPDPYPVVLPSSEQRTFTCVISDGRSPTQTFTRTIVRILPTPTPTVTPTATPAVIAACPGDLCVDQSHPLANDLNTCTTLNDPCLTIGGALAKAGGGNTVYIFAGTYNESNLSPPANVTVQGASTATVIVTGAPSGTRFNITNTGVNLQNMTIIDAGAVNGVLVSGAGVVVSISNVDITVGGGGNGVNVIGGTLNVSNSTITSGFYGARAQSGNLTISSSTITGDSCGVFCTTFAACSIGGGATLSNNGANGVVGVWSGATLNISNTTLNTTGAPTWAILCQAVEKVTCGAGITDNTGAGTGPGCTELGFPCPPP